MSLSEKPAYRGCISCPDTFVYCIKLPRLASGRARREGGGFSRRGTTRGFYFYDLPLRLSTLLRTLSATFLTAVPLRWHVGVYKARPETRRARQIYRPISGDTLSRAKRETPLLYYRITQFRIYISVECIPKR